MLKIDYTQLGGFPLEQHVLNKMQTAYFDTLKAFVGYLGIADVGNYILFGCQVVGGDITPGMMYIDGDLCTWSGSAGTAATKIKKAVITSTAAFENGTNPVVFSNTVAQVNAAGAELATFTRLFAVYDEFYTHTDFNFTEVLKTKLEGIEAGAQKNVQADWDVLSPLSDAFIKNKPLLLDVLDAKAFLIGDFGTSGSMYDEIVTVPFPDIGTSDYRVLYSLESLGDWNVDNDTISVIRNKTSNSFDICLREATSGFSMIQNLRLQYYLIRI